SPESAPKKPRRKPRIMLTSTAAMMIRSGRLSSPGSCSIRSLGIGKLLGLFGMRGKDTRVPGVECEYGAVVGHQQAACADRFGVAPERGEIRVIGGYAGCAEHCCARSGDRQRGWLFGQAAGIGERAAAHGVQVAARVARIRAG